MERSKGQSTNSFHNQNSFMIGRRVFGQELTNLSDLLRLNKEQLFSKHGKKSEVNRSKNEPKILSSRVNVSVTSHATSFNELRARGQLEKNRSQENRSKINLSKANNHSKTQLNDSNSIFLNLDQMNMETEGDMKKNEKSLIKERTQSLYNQNKSVDKLTVNQFNQRNQYSLLRNIGQKECKRYISENTQLNLSNQPATQRHNYSSYDQVNTSHGCHTVRFHDLRVIQSQDKSISDRNLIQKLDKQNHGKPEHIPHYAEESFQYLLSIEKSYLPDPAYLLQQTEVNQLMRSILLDWMIDVQFKFGMRFETLHLTINLLDRYLAKVPVQRKYFQLVGVGAMLIASKTEEIYAPQVKDLSLLTKESFTKQNIVNVESQILSVLDFQLNAPTVYSFLNRYQTLSPVSVRHYYLALFAVELQLVHAPQESLSSAVAAGAFFLVRKLKKYEPLWPKELEISSQCSETIAKAEAKSLCSIIQQSQSPKPPSYLQAVLKKYSNQKYQRVSMLKTKPSTQTCTTQQDME